MRKLPQLPASEPGVKKDRVLIVDSERLMSRVTKRILEDQGYSIDEVSSPADAFETIVRHQYRCVLIDDSIDDVELKNFLSAARDVVGYRAPVVILSDHAFRLDAAVSPVVFLPKPFTYDELVDLLALLGDGQSIRP